MFDLGIQELVVIFVVALLVFGPKRLPEIARAIGKGIAEMKRSLDSVKTEIDTEMQEVKKLKDLNDPIALKNEIFKNESLIKPYEDVSDFRDDKSGGGSIADRADSANGSESMAQKTVTVPEKKNSSAKGKSSHGRKVKG
jgi:Tat protein translocase TatB subunit